MKPALRVRLPVAALLGCALSACSLFPGSAPPPDQLPFDHYDPVVLNEYAVAKLRAGDDATALILLERAALLAPHDPRITRNLALLRAVRNGTDPPAFPSTSAPARAAGSGDAGIAPVAPARPLPEPPPAWDDKTQQQ
jgi:hypothetical protein